MLVAIKNAKKKDKADDDGESTSQRQNNKGMSSAKPSLLTKPVSSKNQNLTIKETENKKEDAK